MVVLGPYMADRIALKQVAAERIATIPVWSRRDEIYPIPRAANPLRKSLGLERRVRRDVLGQPRPGPLVRRVPRRRPAGSATARTSSSSSSAAARDWPRSRPRSESRGT